MTRRDGHRFFGVAVLLSSILLVAVLVSCAAHPQQPKPSTPPPTIDAAATLRADAAALGFPIRSPQLPSDWHATSAKRDSMGSARSVTSPRKGLETAGISKIDYLTSAGTRISLIQSNADERYLVEYLDTSSTFEQALHPSGKQYVDDVQWVVYTGQVHKDPVWTIRLNGLTGPAQVAITGAAGEDDYRTLAAAVQSQAPLPAS